MRDAGDAGDPDGAADGAADGGCVEFLYTGQDSSVIPRDVSHVRVAPSVEVIGEDTFCNFNDLAEVDIGNGVLSIERCSFANCRSLTRVAIPPSVRAIGERAFSGCNRLEKVDLCEGVESIKEGAFNGCGSLRHVKIPSTVKKIAKSTFSGCEKIEKVELFEGLKYIEEEAFSGCKALKSLEIPSSVTYVGEDSFEGCSSLRNVLLPKTGHVHSQCFALGNCDLLDVFARPLDVVESLQNRFNPILFRKAGLPIHRACYHQSSYPTKEIIEQLKLHHQISYPTKEIMERLNQNEGLINDTSYGTQDCLGMTPLHILALSSRPNIELMKFIIGEDPSPLVTEDKWGCLPLLYAVWNDAPGDAVQLLIESQQSAFPDYAYDWNGMMKSLAKAGVAMDAVIKLLDIRQTFYPDQVICWNEAGRGVLVDCLIRCNSFEELPTLWSSALETLGSHQDLVHILLEVDEKYFPGGARQINTNWQTVFEEFAKPLNGFWRPEDPQRSLHVLQLLIRNRILERISDIGIRSWRESIISLPSSSLDYPIRVLKSVKKYGLEYERLRETIFTLELGLWRTKLHEMERVGVTKEQCRLICGAEVIIPNVYPYLIDSGGIHEQKTRFRPLLGLRNVNESAICHY